MPLTSPGNDDDTGENHQPTLRKNTAEPVEQTLKQNKVAASQLARPDSGFGGVLSFGLDTDHDGHTRFVSKLNVITSAVSLGHD